MQKIRIIITIVGLGIMSVGFLSRKTETPQGGSFVYNLNMVHHNPGEPPFETKYNDPFYLKEQGFNGQVPRIFLPCAITYETFDPKIMPEGSKNREQTEGYAPKLDSMFRKGKEAGIPIYPFTDLLVVPNLSK
jgi:hypothetical protein